ncbi:MAG: hypothetical protein Q9195_005180 [Heterodermia aff. obscurata]
METTGDPSESIKRFGLTQITPAGPALVDVIFIHGLDGHPYRTWASEATKTFWPAQLLPPILEEEKARILVYGYNADVTPVADGVLSKEKIHNHAQNLLAELWANRKQQQATDRPIIFIAHSLGGLIVKRALVHSSGIRGNKIAHLRSIYVSTHAILFFGTPHKGFDIESWISRWKPKPGSVEFPNHIDVPPQIIHSLGIKSETLENLDRQFIQLCYKISIYFFYEAKPTNIRGSWHYVVEEESAAPIIQDVEYASFQQDHTHMCRFENESSPGYSIVTEAIQRYAAEAPKKIQADRRSERAEGKVRIDAPVREFRGDDIGLVDKADNTLGSRGGVPSPSGLLDSETSPSSRQKRYYIVPRERVKHFVGRDAQLRQISSYFATRSANRPQVLVLHALGGQGKSQIAIEYCQISREQYAGIFWVNASSEDMAVQSYARIAAAVSGSSSSEIRDGQAVVKTVMDYLSNWDQAWLLVFDNYDKPEEFPHVQKFLPEFGHGHIIFTSRRNEELDRLGSLLEIPAMNAHEGISLLLRGHSDQDIEQHLMTASKIVDRLGGLPLAIDQAAAYIRSQRLPLHLLGNFLTTYDPKRREVLSHIPPRFWEYGTMQIHGKEERKKALNAFTTWELSLEQLKTDGSFPSDEMTHFLTLAAFFNPVRIEEWLFRYYSERDHCIEDCAAWEQLLSAPDKESADESDEGSGQDSDHSSYQRSADDPDQGNNGTASLASNDKIDDEINDDHYNSRLSDLASDANPRDWICERRWNSVQFWDVLSKFKDLSLIQSLEGPPEKAIFSLHPLIRDWLQLRDEEYSPQRMTAESVAVVAASAKSSDYEDMSLEQRTSLLAHIDAVVLSDNHFTKEQHQLGHDIQNCGNAYRLAAFYDDQGHYKAAEKLLSRISATQTKLLGKEHKDTLETMHLCGALLHSQGILDESEKVKRQTVQLKKRILGEEHESTLRSLISLAATLQQQYKFDGAESRERQLLQIHENKFGKEHLSTIKCSTMLASTLRLQGKLAEAEKMQREALHVGETVLGRHHRIRVEVMHKLLPTLQEQRKNEEAEKIGREVLHLSESIHGKKYPTTLSIKSLLAVTLFLRGRNEEAVKSCRKVLELHEKVRGKNHPNTLDCRDRLAWMLSHDESSYDEAEQLCRQTLVLRKDVLGSEHPGTLYSMHLLGWILSRQESSYEEAEQLLRETCQLRNKVLGSEHVNTLYSMNLLGEILSRQESSYEEAEQLLRETCQLRKKVLGIEHPDTLSSMRLLGDILSQHESSYDEAEQLFRETYQLRKRVVGSEHLSTLYSMSLLGWLLSQQESSYDEAEQILHETYQLRKKVQGSEHPNTIETMRDLAQVLRQQGKCDDVEEISQQISEVKTETNTALDNSPNLESPVEVASLPDQRENSRKKKRWLFNIRKHLKKGYDDTHGLNPQPGTGSTASSKFFS